MGGLRAIEIAHVAAVAQHGDPVGQVQHLFHAMRDVDDGDALGAELADDLEELLRLAGGQRGRGLVHDDDAGLEGQGLGDLHHLHLARR